MTTNFYQKIFHFFLLTTIIITCYSGSLENSWHFDDFPNIVKNKNIQIENLSWNQIKKSFYSHNEDRISRPLSGLSFALNYLFFGLDLKSYHIVNILIHVLCCITVYLVFITTLNICIEKNNVSIPKHLVIDIALLGAVLWAIHPIQTQAITYIVQRMASMAALFYVIALYCYLKFRLQSVDIIKILLFLLCILFWVAGMLSKENVVLLPLSIIAYELIIFRTRLIYNKKFVFLIFLCFAFMIVVSLFLISGKLVQFFENAYEYRPHTMWQRFITQPIILVRYILLLFLPIADFLTLESNIFASKGLLSPPITFFSNILIYILIFMSIFFSKKFPLVCFSLIFYFVNHLIESTVIDLELYFEHRNYLPSIFIYLTISCYLIYFIYLYKNLNKKYLYFLLSILTTSIIVSEGNATYLRNEIWKDEISLNLDNIEKSPLNLRGYNNLAAEYIKLDQKEKALDYLKQAEKIYKQRPDDYQKNGIADIYYNAGLIQLHAYEDIDKATQLLLKSVELHSLGFMVHYQLAVAFFRLGDLDNAETAIFNSAQLKDDQSQIYNLFGRILYAQEKYDLAIEVLRKGFELEKRRELCFNLVATYLKIGDYKNARSILFSIDFSNTDLLYLLFRLVVSDELERDIIINYLIDIMFEKELNFCNWLQEINNNNHVGIIYPDISIYKNIIAQYYILKLNNKITKTKEMIYAIEAGCR